LTYEILWSDEAFAAAQSFMIDSPVGLAALFDEVDRLATDPRPAGAFPWGGADLLRLRVGRYRILYEIGEATVRVAVIHLGRS
jgi:mRNA interferase RelE/StbE